MFQSMPRPEARQSKMLGRLSFDSGSRSWNNHVPLRICLMEDAAATAHVLMLWVVHGARPDSRPTSHVSIGGRSSPC